MTTPQVLTDYLVKLSESISTQKAGRLARCLSQTADPVNNVLRALHGRQAGRGLTVDKEWLEEVVGRRVVVGGRSMTGLSDEWKGVVVNRIWAGWMEEQENWIEAYEAQKQSISTYIRHCTTHQTTSWTLPPLYTLLRDLAHLAPLADNELTRSNFNSEGGAGVTGGSTGDAQKYGEDCARVFQAGFKLCVGDRGNEERESKRKGVYRMAWACLGWYFKIDRPNLAKQLIRAVQADPTIPPLTTYKMSDRVTWEYYLGLLAFRAGDDVEANRRLGWAWEWCYEGSRRNQELILIHLIPARIRLGLFPSPALFQRYPRIHRLYGTFIDAIRFGDVKAYDRALERLQSGEMGGCGGGGGVEGDEAEAGVDTAMGMDVGMGVDVGVWMALERGREVCLRGLMRGVWIASDKESRIPISSFRLALRHQGLDMDEDEVECLVAGLIWKGYMKGYISHEKRTVVLAKNGPFPALNKRVRPTGG